MKAGEILDKNDVAPQQAAAHPALFRCPFCGGKSIELRSNGIGDFYAICSSDDEGEMYCGARTSDRNCETEAGAIDRWNRRAAATETICGACGQQWTGEKCGQADNGHPFPVCYPFVVSLTDEAGAQATSAGATPPHPLETRR